MNSVSQRHFRNITAAPSVPVRADGLLVKQAQLEVAGQFLEVVEQVIGIVKGDNGGAEEK